MKILVIGLLALTGYVLAEFDEQLVAHSKECIAQIGIDKESAMKLKAHDFSSDDPKLKCFAKCFCEKAAMCDNALNLNVAKIEEHVPENKRHMMDEAIATCAETSGSDDCDTVYKKFKCFFAHIHK